LPTTIILILGIQAPILSKAGARYFLNSHVHIIIRMLYLKTE